MRNLKKFLALVLTVMMVMGLMVTANAAVSIPTTGDVTPQYETAVEVLYALGVIKGRDNGVYDPEDTITRAEFATMLYRIGTGDVNAAKAKDFEKYNEFSDVENGYWHSGPVGYALHNGLMNGRDVGIFEPWEDVTGYEALTGLLRVLGFDANGELSGSNWNEGAVYGWAVSDNAELTTSLQVSRTQLRQPATCELVAQIVYNALNKPQVWYNPIDDEYVPDGDTLGETVFGLLETSDADDLDDLELDDNPLLPDAFGRPKADSVIVANGKVVSGERPGYVKVFDEAMPERDIFSAVGAAGIAGTGTEKYIVMDEIYIDGELVAAAKEATDGTKTWFEAALNTDADTDTVTACDPSEFLNEPGGIDETVIITKNTYPTDFLAAGFGYGVTVELYANGANHYIMVIINEYLGQVTDVDEDEGTITITGVDGTEYDALENDEYEEDDYVLFTKVGSEIQSVTAPLTIPGKVTAISKPSTHSAYDVYTVGGADVKLSQKKAPGLTLDVLDEGEWFLDSCGNIIGEAPEDDGSSAPTTPANTTVYYGYLLAYKTVEQNATAEVKDAFGNVTTEAKAQSYSELFRLINSNGQAVTLEGAWKPVTVSNVTTVRFVASDSVGGGSESNLSGLGVDNSGNDGADKSGDDAWDGTDDDVANNTKNILFAYKLDDDGKICEIVSTGAATGNYNDDQGNTKFIGVAKGNPVIDGGSANTLGTPTGNFGTDDTIYFVIKSDDTSKVKVYTGYKNVPSEVVSVAATGNTDVTTASAQWLATDNNVDAIVLLVTADPTAGGDDDDEGEPTDGGYVYFTTGTPSVAVADDGETLIYTYKNVYINGELADISFESEQSSPAGKLYPFTLDEDGLATLGSEITTISQEVTSLQSGYYLTGGAVKYTKSSVVYYRIETANGTTTMTKMTFAELKALETDGYTITVTGIDGTGADMSDNAIKALFFSAAK